MPPERPTPHWAASGNVAPTDPLPTVRYDAKAQRRSLQVMRWGLVPFWVKDINAKTEGV
jgi:putative SOS response-associated peptidase YedK